MEEEEGLKVKYVFKHTLQVISRRKKNFILTAFVVALGISLVVQTEILNSTIARNYKEVVIEAYGNADIVAYSLNQIYFSQNISDTLIQELISDFEGILPQITYSTTVYYPSEGQFEQGVRVETIGSSFDSEFWGSINSNSTNTQLDISSLSSDEIVISPDLANSLKASVGARVTIYVLDDRGNPFFHNVTIKDIYSYTGYGRTGNPTDFRRIFMAEKAIQSLIPSSISYPITQILFGIQDHAEESFLGREITDEAKEKIDNILINNYPEEIIEISTIRENDRESIEEDVAAFASTFQMFGIVVIIAGLLLISNIQLMNMEERQQQIGMLRGIGAKKRDIFASYSIETLLIGILGGIFGIIVGVGISVWLNGLSRDMLSAMGNPDVKRSIFDVVVEPSTLLTSLIFAIILSVATGMVPALRARGVSIIDIIRGTKSKAIASSFSEKKPLWPLIIGTFFLIFGLITLITLIQQGKPFYAPDGYRNVEKEAPQNFEALGYVILGLIFASFRLKKQRRLSLTIGGLLLILLTIWGFQVIVDWAERGGSGNRIAILGLLWAVIGATTIVGANLEAITALIRKFLSISKRTRATGLVATRYINSRKSRAVLTFATFAVILSLNFFVGSFAASQVSGSNHVWEEYMTNIPLVVESQVPFDLTNLDFPNMLKSQFSEIEKVYPLGVGAILPFKGSMADISPEEDIFYSKIVAINYTTFTSENGDAIYPFIFDELLPYYSELSILTRMKNLDQSREESQVFWRSFLAGQKIHRESLQPVDSDDPNGLNMFIGDYLYFLDVGDIVTFPLSNEGFIEMIYAGSFSYFPSFNLDINRFTSGIVMDARIAYQLKTLGFGIKEFLVETTYGFDYQRNEELSNQIEGFSNKESTNSLLKLTGGTFYGITVYNLWDFLYIINSANASALNFLQIFISSGLVIGVIGLLVVSHRSVKERKREIGMLRSVGFSKKAVSLAILLELLFLGVLGFVVGFLTGNYLALMFTDIQSWNLIIPWAQVGIFGAFILGSILIAAIIPAWLAARIPPSEALRYHG